MFPIDTRGTFLATRNKNTELNWFSELDTTLVSTEQMDVPVPQKVKEEY